MAASFASETSTQKGVARKGIERLSGLALRAQVPAPRVWAADRQTENPATLTGNLPSSSANNGNFLFLRAFEQWQSYPEEAYMSVTKTKFGC